jgi:hypothetical protein
LEEGCAVSVPMKSNRLRLASLAYGRRNAVAEQSCCNGICSAPWVELVDDKGERPPDRQPIILSLSSLLMVLARQEQHRSYLALVDEKTVYLSHPTLFCRDLKLRRRPSLTLPSPTISRFSKGGQCAADATSVSEVGQGHTFAGAGGST